MQIDSLTVGIGFKVDYEKLDKLQARLKSINKLWEGITSKKLDSLEKGPIAAAKRADNEMAKIKKAAEAKEKQLRILKEREDKAKERTEKKQILEKYRNLKFMNDLVQKRKKEEMKAEADKALDKADKEKQEEDNRKKRAAEAMTQMKELRKGAIITAAAVTAAYAGFSKMFEHARDSAQSIRNIMLTTGVDRKTLKNLGYSGAEFGLSEKEMFANVKSIMSAHAALTMGGNAAPFAALGLSPTDSIEATIKKLRSASRKVDPNIFRNLAGQLGASDDFLAWITGGKDIEMPRAFSLSVDEYNQTLRAAESWNKLLYLMGQFGDKLMSKSGDKLVTVFTAIINMLDMTLRLIDKLEANPITKKMFGIGKQAEPGYLDYAQDVIESPTVNYWHAGMRFAEWLNKYSAARSVAFESNMPTSAAAVMGQVASQALDKSTLNNTKVMNSGGNTYNNRLEIYDGAGAARVIDYLELQQSGYQIPYGTY